MPETTTDPRSLLPLPHLEYQVLVSLAAADLHGYAIVKEVGARNHDTSTAAPGPRGRRRTTMVFVSWTR